MHHSIIRLFISFLKYTTSLTLLSFTCWNTCLKSGALQELMALRQNPSYGDQG